MLLESAFSASYVIDIVFSHTKHFKLIIIHSLCQTKTELVFYLISSNTSIVTICQLINIHQNRTWPKYKSYIGDMSLFYQLQQLV